MTRAQMAGAFVVIAGVGLAAVGALARWADEQVVIAVVFGVFVILAVTASTLLVVRLLG